MAYGDGESVGGVVGGRHLLEVEEHFYHALDLALFRAAVACDCLLDLLGCVFAKWKIGLGGGEDGNAAAFTDGHGAFYIYAEEELFEAGDIGAVFVDDEDEFVVYALESLGQGFGGAGFDAAVGQHDGALSVVIDNAIAGVGQAGIDAKDSHGGYACTGAGVLPEKTCAGGVRLIH